MTLRLLQIELKKLISYRTFWVILGLYCLLLEVTVSGGIQFSTWLEKEVAINASDIGEIGLYHFPHIWQNIAYISGFFKIMLGFIVIIGISNEFVHRTARQNIIDGLSREQFIGSKIITNILLSLLSAILVFFTVLFLGIKYNPDIEMLNVFVGVEIIFAYWLEIFTFLSFAFFISMLVQQTGLAIILLIVSPIIEGVLANMISYASWLTPYLPMEAIGRLVEIPFFKQQLPTSQNEFEIHPSIVALAWAALFNWVGYIRFKKTDI